MPLIHAAHATRSQFPDWSRQEVVSSRLNGGRIAVRIDIRMQHWKKALVTTLCVVACSRLSLAQAPPTILEVDVENYVAYFEDSSDLSKFATNPNPADPMIPRNFYFYVFIGDISAVNGQPAKGTLTRHAARQVLLSTAPNPGQAIADTVRNSAVADTFEILKSDGTPIGTIMSYGVNSGSPPPGRL